MSPVSTELVPQEAGNRDDYDRELDNVKKNVHDLLAIGNQAMADLANIVFSSQQGKDYESLAKMMSELRKMNETALKVAEQKFRLENPPESEGTGVTIEGNQTINHNTIVFEGSPADLDKFLEKKRNGEL